MKLSSIFIVTFGIGVISYPVMHLPGGKAFIAEGPKKQAEPVPKPKKNKTDFGIAQIVKEEISQKDKEYKIIINIPATKLTLYEDEKPVLEFPVAVGQVIYKTPTGHQEIKKIEWNPWWYPPDSEWAKNDVITPPGPKNPLGPVKLPMSDDLRLHGTNKDRSIGSAASHGCIRLHSKDAVTLAWYLQSHLSDKADPALLEKYKKMGSTTFHVSLNKTVPVDIIYRPIAFNEDAVTIYPDLYGKVKDINSEVAWTLFNNGIDPFNLNLALLPKVKKTPQTIHLKDLY